MSVSFHVPRTAAARPATEARRRPAAMTSDAGGHMSAAAVASAAVTRCGCPGPQAAGFGAGLGSLTQMWAWRRGGSGPSEGRPSLAARAALAVRNSAEICRRRPSLAARAALAVRNSAEICRRRPSLAARAALAVRIRRGSGAGGACTCKQFYSFSSSVSFITHEGQAQAAPAASSAGQ